MPSIVASRFWRGFARFFVGDDVFISYSHRDASDYALVLSGQLASRGFSCYLDQTVSEPGRELPPTLLKALDRASMLVLLGTPQAGESLAIQQELALFRSRTKRPRPLVVVDVDGSFETARWKDIVDGAPRVPETLDNVTAAAPSDLVVQRSINSATFMRRNQRLRNTGAILVSAVALLAGATALSLWQAKQQMGEFVALLQGLDTANASLSKARKDLLTQEGEVLQKKQELDALRESTERVKKELEVAAHQAQEARTLADRAQSTADSMQLANSSEEIVELAPERALALAVAAMTKSPSPAARRALIETSSQFVPYRRLGSVDTRQIVFSSDSSSFVLDSWKPFELHSFDHSRVLRFSEPNADFVGYSSPNEVVVKPLANRPRLWNLLTGASQEWKTDSPDVFEASAMSQDGKRLVVWSGGALTVWSTDGQKESEISVADLSGQSPEVHDNASLYLVSNDHKVLLRDEKRGFHLVHLETGKIEGTHLFPFPILGLSVATQSNYLAIALEKETGNEIELWNFETWHQVQHDSLQGNEVALNPQGILLATGSSQGFKVHSLGSTDVWQQSDLNATELHFDASNRLLVLEGRGGARLYDTIQRRLIARLRDPSASYPTGAFVPGKNAVISTSEAGARLWNLDLLDGERQIEFTSPDDASFVTVSPNGQTTLVMDAGRRVWKILEGRNPTCIARLPEFSSKEKLAFEVVWSRGGSQILLRASSDEPWTLLGLAPSRTPVRLEFLGA